MVVTDLEAWLDEAKGLIVSLHQTKLGGPVDTCAIAAIVGGTVSALVLPIPLMAGVVNFVLVAAGAAWLTWTYLEEIRNRFALPSSINVESAQSPIKLGEKPGLLIGYSTDRGEPIVLPDEELFRHMMIAGMSGVGKTVAGSLMMVQQIERGGGLLFVDGKLDYGNIHQLYQFAQYFGRGADFQVVNPGDPQLSNSYNPILDGNPYEVASRTLSMVSDDPAADYYKSEANQAIMTVVAAIQRAGRTYNFDDLSILFNSSAALEDLENICLTTPSSRNAKETRDLQLWIDRFRLPRDPSGKNPLAGQIDLKRMKETLGGVTSKMSSFSTGSFGDVMNTYSPEVRLYEAFKQSKIVYVALPTMGMPDAASAFGKMLVGDLRTACSWLQKNTADRPKIPFMCFLDEARSYFSENWGVLFEQARSAGLFLLPALQVLPTDAKTADAMDRVIGNTTTKMFFRLGTNETAEKSADLIGQHTVVQNSMGSTASASESAQTIKATPGVTAGDGFGESSTQREGEDYRVSPDKLKKLDKGEAVLLYEGRDVFNIRIPMIGLTQDLMKRLGETKIHRQRPDMRKINQGLNLRDKSEKYLKKSKGHSREDEDEEDADAGDDIGRSDRTARTIDRLLVAARSHETKPQFVITTQDEIDQKARDKDERARRRLESP